MISMIRVSTTLMKGSVRTTDGGCQGIVKKHAVYVKVGIVPCHQ